jgi:hypothetical protein
MKAHDLRPETQHESREAREHRAGRNARERAAKIVKRNRAQRPLLAAELRARLPKRLARDDFQTELHDGGRDWKQPGRRYGPIPLGGTPKMNKLTDPDGNPRIAPLSADQRLMRYYVSPGHRNPRPATPTDDETEQYMPGPSYVTGEDARRHAQLLGVTTRQRRRMVHKANHATAPFGERVAS